MTLDGARSTTGRCLSDGFLGETLRELGLVSDEIRSGLCDDSAGQTLR